MEIVSIFAGRNPREGVFSIKFDDEDFDEFDKLSDQWLDVEYLHDFFSDNSEDLDSDFFAGRDLTIKKAIHYTRHEAYSLFEKLDKNNSKLTLSKLFKPFNKKEPENLELLKSKAYSFGEGGWLRIYAIKISDHTFLITGGGIKLVKKNQHKEHLVLEMEKMEKVREYLIKANVLSQNDFNSFEI